MDNRKVPEERIAKIIDSLFLEKNDVITSTELVSLGIPKRTLDGWVKKRKLNSCVVSKKAYFNVKDLICFFRDYSHKRIPWHTHGKSGRKFLKRTKQSISQRGLRKALPRPAPPPNSSASPGIGKLESGRWQAIITVKGKRYQLGTYETKEDAIAARKEIEDYVYYT